MSAHASHGHGHSHGLIDPSIKRSREGLRAVAILLKGSLLRLRARIIGAAV